MKTVFSRDELLKLRALIDNALEAAEDEAGATQSDKPRHELGGQITLHSSVIGDILMDCIEVYEDGAKGLYLMHYGLPHMEFDAAESAGRGQDWGNNDYELSNVRAWLNSAAADWWKRTHVFDAPPSYADAPGLLHGLSEETLARIVPNAELRGDKFFLLSHEDVTGGIPYFKTEAGKKLLVKTDVDGDRVWWWLRSPLPGNSSYVRVVNLDGYAGADSYAYYRNGAVAAACVIA